MAKIKIHMDRIIDNVNAINAMLGEKGYKWSLVVKVLGSHRPSLQTLLANVSLQSIHSIADSHWEALRIVKEINPETRTLYLRPPTLQDIEQVVEYSDISLNSSSETIHLLNNEARRRNKMHQIIVMIELGELREGILRKNILDFYETIFHLSNIQVIGMGTSLGCMYGLEPTYDKLIQLSLYAQLIEMKFGKHLDLISGATSITLPFFKEKGLLDGINHFRIGEAVFLGTSPFTQSRFGDLHDDTFELEANIIELAYKDSIPDGIIGNGSVGHVATAKKGCRPSYKGILDFGVVDVDPVNLTPIGRKMTFFGSSSDMTVYDLGRNKFKKHIGDTVRFRPDYMGVARLMTSRFIEKTVMPVSRISSPENQE